MAESRPTKVYLLLIATNIPYLIEGASDILGVFSTREKAEEIAQARIGEYHDDLIMGRPGQVTARIYEMEVDLEYSFSTTADYP